MMWKYLVPFLALSACGSTSLPVEETFTASRRATLGNEYKTQPSLVRSYAVGEDGKRVEVKGAVCSASSTLVSVKNVTTPALVKTPMYLQAERFPERGKPPALNWRCSYRGKVVKLTTEPSSGRNNTVTQGVSTYDAATGTYSQPTSIVLTGRLSSTLPWSYPNVEVEF